MHQTTPWLEGNVPNGYWKIKENRINAVKWLIEILNKPLKEISRNDFIAHKLWGLLSYYKSSTYKALQEAGFEVDGWGLKRTKYKFWTIKENRVKAIQWLIRKTGKPYKQLTSADFKSFGLSGLLSKYYGGSVFKALKESEYNINEFELGPGVPKRYWQDRERRIQVIKKFAQTINKPLTEISQKDFREYGLWGILTSYYNSSPLLALEDAGFDVRAEERSIKPQGYWKNRENRIKMIRDMVHKSGKPLHEFTQKDFRKFHIWKLLTEYYQSSHILALKDAGYNIEPWQMRKKPNRYWSIRDNRIFAIKRFVLNLNKTISEITEEDFHGHGLAGCLKYYNDSPYLALIDAGFNVKKEEMKHGLIKSGPLRYQSNHGHYFKSIMERDLDNLFWSWGLKDHTHNVPYPNSKMNCDFVFGNKYWVEYAGLLRIVPLKLGRKMNYNQKIVQKIKLAKLHGLHLIILSPWDIKNDNLKKKMRPVIEEFGHSLHDFIKN
jgi:hypothetical protein